MHGQQAILALVLAAAGLLVWTGRGMVPPRRRPRRPLDPVVRRMLVAAVGALAIAVLLSWPWWVALGCGGAAAVAARLTPVRQPQPDVSGMRELAGILDLLATCLDAGMAIGAAIVAVLDASRSAADGSDASAATRAAATQRYIEILAEVAALLTLGADPRAAWQPAASEPDLATLAAAAQRSALGGVRLADAAREAAADVRARCRRAGDRGAARAGVAMTAPLAVCFLPAFVCLGLAPVIIGLVSTLHIW